MKAEQKKNQVTSPSRSVSGTSVSTEKPSAYAPQSLSKETNIPFKKSEPVAAAPVAAKPELPKVKSAAELIEGGDMPIVNKGASILKIKDENIKRLDIEKSDILKKKMAEDLMEHDNSATQQDKNKMVVGSFKDGNAGNRDAYTQKYIDKLSSMGYDKKAVSEYADKINKSKEDLRQAEKDLDAVELTLNPIKTFGFDETLGQNGRLDASGNPINFTGIPQKSTEVEAKTSAYMPKSIKESVDKFAAKTESTAAKSAAEAKSTATQQYKNEKTRASFKAANALLTLGNPDAAINMFTQALGNLTEETERTEYQEVVQGGSRDIQTTYDPSLNPAYSFTGLATAYLNKKDYVKAIEYYQQALDYYKYKSPEAEVGVSTGGANKVMPVDGDNNALSTALDGLALAKFKMGDKAGSQQAMMESNQIKKENTKQYALANQISVEAADEVQKQKRSEEVGGIHDMLTTFLSGYDPENQLGTLGYLNFPMKYISGIQQGSQTIGEGMKIITDQASKGIENARKTGDFGLKDFNSALISGGLTILEGIAGTTFASIPAVQEFNLKISLIKDLARLLPKEGETAVNELLEMPFTVATLFAKSLNLDINEKSDAAKILRLTDTALSFLVLHGINKGGEAAKKAIADAPLFSGVKNIADLKEIVGKIAKKGDPAEIKQIKTYTDYLKSLKLDDIKKAAEKNGDKEIAKTIESVQKKTPTDALHVKLAELKSDVRDENGNPNPEFEKLPASAQKEVLSNITALEKEISDKEISDVNNMSRASKLEADIHDIDSQIAETESKLPNFSAATQESVKRTINELKDKRNQLKTEQDAIQKQSTGGLLQSKTEGTGEPGGKRGTLEQGVEGAEAATEGEKIEVDDLKDAESTAKALDNVKQEVKSELVSKSLASEFDDPYERVEKSLTTEEKKTIGGTKNVSKFIKDNAKSNNPSIQRIARKAMIAYGKYFHEFKPLIDRLTEKEIKEYTKSWDLSDIESLKGTKWESLMHENVDNLSLSPEQKAKLNELDIKPLNTKNTETISRGDSRNQPIDYSEHEQQVLENIKEEDGGYSYGKGSPLKDVRKGGLGLGMKSSGNWAGLVTFFSPKKRSGTNYPMISAGEFNSGARAYTHQYEFTKKPVIISKSDAQKISKFNFKNKQELIDATKKFKELGIDGIYDSGEIQLFDAHKILKTKKIIEEGRKFSEQGVTSEGKKLDTYSEAISHTPSESIAETYHDILNKPESERTQKQEEFLSSVETALNKKRPQRNVIGEKVKVENAPKGSHLNIGLLDGRTNKLMSHEELLSKLPEGVEVVSYKEVPAMEPTLSIETSRPLTDAEMIKLLEDTKQQAIPQIVEGEGILYDNMRGTKDGWGEFNPEYFITQEGKNLKEAAAIKPKPEPLTKSEKAKYDILKSKEKRGKATDADKANIAKYDKKIDQAGIVERTKSAVSNVIKALKKIVPTLEVKTYETTKEFEAAAREQAFTEEYYKLKEKQEIEELTLEEIQKIKDIENKANSSIKAGGLFDGETIHLNLEKIKTNSLFHEAVHPILNAINAVNPKAISRIFEQVKTVEKKLGIEGKYTEEFASNYEQSRKEMEAITEFIADVADGNIEITKSNFDFIKKAFVDMMRYLGVDLSSSIKTVGELKNLAENIAYSFETGTELSISKKGKSGFLDTSGKPLSISDMQYSIHNDFSDAVTKLTFEYLANAEKFKKLQEAGFITDNKTFDEYNNRHVFFHSPDGAFTGMIFKNGQLMVEGKGGLYYPIRFHEDGYFWASTESAANGMVAQLNAQAKLNGGKIFMALTSAPIDKLLSSTTVSNGVMDLFLSKILDKKTNISKSIVRQAIFEAAHADSAVMKNIKVRLKEDLTDSKNNEKLKIKNEELKQKHGKVYRDDKGQYVYKKELVGLKLSSLDLKGDLEEMVSTIRRKLAADKSTFKDRKHYTETLITKIAAKIKGTPAEQSLGEFLHIGISNLEMKNVTKKGYNLSKANISAAISHMFHEPLIRPEAKAPLKKGEKAKEANGRVYAVLELECKPEKIRLEGKSKKEIKALTKMYGDPIKDSSGSYVEAYIKTIDSNKHESYPKAIVPTDGKSKTKVHIMQDRELWHENVLDPKTGKRPKANRLKSIFPTSGVTNTSLLVSAREKGEGEVSGKAEAETTSKAGTDPVAKAGKRKEMTEDDKGNYLFFHYSDAKFNKLNPEKVGKHLATSRGETPAKKMSMLYTRPDRLEPGVPSQNGYVVRVPKDKVYHFNSDPLNLLPEAEKLFRKENGKDKSFDLNNQVAYVSKVAAEKGFPVTTSDWNIKGTKALRAQTTEVLPVEKYSNIKPGTTNQIQFNPEFENVKPNAKRKDLYYSLEGESLETALDRALETAKNSSISKGLAEFKESEYFKKQDKEIQAELEDYFKEEAGPVEKGGLEDKFDALDDIANKLKEPLTKSEINELTSKRKAIFDENPEVKEINDNFSKITRQLEENGELKKSRKDCP